MIRLTRANGKAIYVNPEHLVEVGHDEDYAQTLVSTMAEGWYVLESPEEVARKVLEWWFNMNWLKQGGGGYALAELERLIGLKEEPNHDTR